MIANILRSLGDPDWRFFEQLREGVFEEKVTWALEDHVRSPKQFILVGEVNKAQLWRFCHTSRRQCSPPNLEGHSRCPKTAHASLLPLPSPDPARPLLSKLLEHMDIVLGD